MLEQNFGRKQSQKLLMKVLFCFELFWRKRDSGEVFFVHAMWKTSMSKTARPHHGRDFSMFFENIVVLYLLSYCGKLTVQY